MPPLRYSAEHFVLVRVLLATYVTCHLGSLLPYAGELFGDQSFLVVGERSGFAFRRIFPQDLVWSTFGTDPHRFLVLLLICAGLLGAGIARRASAFLLWYGLTCLINRNPAISNPAQAFVGWLCLACVLVPLGEPWSLRSSRRSWVMPAPLFWGAWWILAVAYSASGVAKLQSAGWVDGSAFAATLEMAYARSSILQTALLGLPTLVLRCCTWMVLGIELSFAPLCLFAPTRRLVWFAGVGLHVALLVLFAFPEISTGMLLFHVFTYDERWVRMGERSGTAPGA